MSENNGGATTVTPEKNDNIYYGVAVDNVKVDKNEKIITGEPSIVVGTNEPGEYERVEGGGFVQVGPSSELTIKLEDNKESDMNFLNREENTIEDNEGLEL